MGLLSRYKDRRIRKQVKRYIDNVKAQARNDVSKRKNVGGSLTGGRETEPLWKRGIYSNTDIPVRRAPHRETNILDTLKLLRDINPDASSAVWTFLRLANQGHEVEVYRPDGSIDEVMQEYINNELAPRIGKMYQGGTDQLINVLNLTGFTEGAQALEVELTERLDDIVDFHVLSPSKLSFMPDKDTNDLHLCEKQTDGTFKMLNENQVFYVPLDPDVDDPYGRSPMLPAIQSIIFQAQVLNDLKAVAHHQGHARLDISVATDAIISNIPPDIAMSGEDAVTKFVDDYMAGVQTAFDKLEPDDDLYHDASITVGMVGGTNGKSMDAQALIGIINQQVVSSLKTLPIMLGRNETTTETHGSIQWEIYVDGIRSIQNMSKRILERAYNLALQIKGSQSKAVVTFNEVRSKDRLAEAQAEQAELNNLITKVNQGWIDNDEASNEAVGHSAVGEPKQTGFDSFSDALQNANEEGRKYNPKRKFPRKALSSSEREIKDDFVADMSEPFSDDIAKIAYKARKAISEQLQNDLDKYVSRLKKAGEPPKRVLKTENNRSAPSDDFEKWVYSKILMISVSDGETTQEEWEDLLEDWIKQTIEKVGQMNIVTIDPQLEFNMLDDKLLTWIDWRTENAAIEIIGTSYQKVMDELWDVIVEGDYSIPKAAERLQQSFGFSEDRAKVIARTEIMTSATVGQFQSDYQSGLVIGKKWNSTHDDRTRHSHSESDGQIRKLDEYFDVGGEKLLHPRDSEHGSAGNTIQCRCFYTRILVGQEDIMIAAGYDEFKEE